MVNNGQFTNDEGYIVYYSEDMSDERDVDLGNILFMVTVCLLMLLILSLCWSCCTEERTNKSLDSDKKSLGQQKVVAQEVRPGLIIVQNCRDSEETLRIIQEYDAMQWKTPQQRFPQYGGVAQAANTRATYIQAANSSYYSDPASQCGGDSAITENLIDMDISIDAWCRPPPYAPPASDK